MDSLQAMRLFVRVSELGSFSAVAQQMGVARSVVTRQVAALEARLGTRLLARSTRSLSLTSSGAVYLERCRVILNLVDEAESGLADKQQVPKGLIRLSLPLHYSLEHLSGPLLEFSTAYPEVELDLQFSDQFSDLIQEGIDLAVRITPHLAPGVVARRLAVSRMLVLASPDYLARHGTPQHPRELIHHACLGYTAGRTSAQHWELMEQKKLTSFPIRPHLRANNGVMLLRAAAAGMGITHEPIFSAAPWIAEGKLVEILKEFPAATLGIYVVLPGNRLIPHRVRILIDFLATRLAPALPLANPHGLSPMGG